MRAKGIAAFLLALGALLAPASQALGASNAPAWRLEGYPLPTNFAPGSEKNEILLVATNVGGAATSGPIAVTDTLPAGLTPTGAGAQVSYVGAPVPSCEVSGQTIACTDAGPIAPGYQLEVTIEVKAGSLPEGTLLADQASVSGGGASEVSLQTQLKISSQVAPFGFIAGPAGLDAPLTEADGAAATQAGSHPYQQTVSLGFPTERVSGTLGAAGHLRDAGSDLPRGMVIDPTATPVLCTEAQLTGDEGCPTAAAVGTATVITVTAVPQAATTPLYNMVPPPGTPAELAFDATGVGIIVHITGSVRSDGDFGLSGESRDALALTFHPVFGARLDLWGDPSSPSHDEIRGKCAPHGQAQTESCPVEAQSTPFLTLPGECPGKPTITRAHADSWEAPKDVKTASYQSADLAGNPVSVSGCNQLSFKPSFTSQPTTNLADSPSGLDFHLHQPQSGELGSLASAALKDATVTLPQGMSANPAQADGLGVCTNAQIGYEPSEGKVRFDKSPDSCPDAAKLGTVKVSSPLLAQLGEDGTKPLRDPEGKAIPRPLEGSVYLAEPFENPFGSLIAIYFSIEDPKSGTVAKLAGKVIPDPITGQLTTRFEENPQLPLEDVTLHLFDGPRAPLITPLACGTHTTTSKLTPWSAPEGADASPSDSFSTSGSPGGGACPGSEAQAPHSPSFSAGTIAPQAGAYSPFVLKLSRADGSQRLAGIEATLPPGLAAKFAGLSRCTEAQIARAKARSNPNEGIIERQNPSCPASSRLGSVDVASGAGPNPLHVGGTAYLSGPYKGAPLSMVIITPAIAGPFDLGAVVVRTALQVDPVTAQGKAVSDPLPQILDGIPLDVRSIAVRLDRPEFTLNPTSCDPMAITASASSSLGSSAALANPFQVGGCPQLPFKPKLSLRLKGGTKRASHPKLVAELRAKLGEANIAGASVQLPRSAFLDQAHIRTICTRVQFAAEACPRGSIYGKASAITPLLDEPLSGNVYLRSSNHKLPDLVVALKGPESLPIEIDLAGKTDSVKGALRNTFEAVPDAPVTRFHLELLGGKRGLVVNSRNLCAHLYKAKVVMEGQNGKLLEANPVVGSDCGGKRRRHRHPVHH